MRHGTDVRTMRLVAAGFLCLMAVSCASNEEPLPVGTPSPAFTLTGVVGSVQPGDHPTSKVGIDTSDGSIRVKTVERRGIDESCLDDAGNVTIFYTSRTHLAVHDKALAGKKIDVAGSSENDCTLFADSVSLHVATTSG